MKRFANSSQYRIETDKKGLHLTLKSTDNRPLTSNENVTEVTVLINSADEVEILCILLESARQRLLRQEEKKAVKDAMKIDGP